MTGHEKFETCQFRSLDLVRIGDEACCSKNIYDGYTCWERGIEGLTPAKCEGCEQYKAKRILDAADERGPFSHHEEN